MTGEYERPAAAPGGLRLHLNENTAGCSPRVLAAHSGADRRGHRVLSRLRRRRTRDGGVPRRAARAGGAHQRARRGHPRRRSSPRRATRSPARAPSGPRSSCRCPRSTCTASRRGRCGGAAGGGHAGAGVRSPGGRPARGDHPAHAAGVHHEPEQSRPACACSARRRSTRGRGAAARGAGVRGRGLPRFLRRHRAPAHRDAAERHRRPHVRQGARAGGAARRMPDRASRHARAHSAHRAAVQPERLRRRRVCAPRSPIARGWRGTSGRWSDRGR